MEKKISIINTITIFLCMFLFHFGYNLFPNFLTAAFFPVNESLFEHLKLMYVTEIVVSLIVYFIFKQKKVKTNNYFLGLLVTTILNISLFFLLFIPIYRRFGENLIITMLLFLVVLIFSEYIFYLIRKKKDTGNINYIALIIIPILWFIIVYFSFNPLHNDFFFDTKEEKYGINSSIH